MISMRMNLRWNGYQQPAGPISSNDARVEALFSAIQLMTEKFLNRHLQGVF